MHRLMRFPDPVRRDPAVEAWLQDRSGALGALARHWFEILRGCGDDVREVLHDGHPTACVHDVAFAYVNAFRAHINVGFFHGAALSDPHGLLEGTGRFMRHVKLRPASPIDTASLSDLIRDAHADVKRRIDADRDAYHGS